MLTKRKKDFLDYGIRVFRSPHRKIRELKRFHSPSLHGFRVWPSSWLLIDYFNRSGFTRGSRVLDVGCGWGLAGIYCAKNHNSIVTCMDTDSAVFPYVRLHADTNNVDITTMVTGFEDLAVVNMKNFEIIIGADICFWDNMFETLKTLILKALKSGVKAVILSDPGREPFEKLGRYFVEEGNGKIMNWVVTRPHPIQGRILRINYAE
jgi:predicted nicotinamide N-methyase